MDNAKRINDELKLTAKLKITQNASETRTLEAKLLEIPDSFDFLEDILQIKFDIAAIKGRSDVWKSIIKFFEENEKEAKASV